MGAGDRVNLVTVSGDEGDGRAAGVEGLDQGEAQA